jgi:purine-binding chemotaxis protein CheW
MIQGRQLATFMIDNNLYGIDVSWVQEVTGALPIVEVPLAPSFVKGLINLRGQIVTAIGMRALFGLESALRTQSQDSMSVICRFEGNLVSLLVDSIGDVMEVAHENFEPVPMTVAQSVRQFLGGVYKIDGPLLSVLDVVKVADISSEFMSPQKNFESKIA